MIIPIPHFLPALLCPVFLDTTSSCAGNASAAGSGGWGLSAQNPSESQQPDGCAGYRLGRCQRWGPLTLWYIGTGRVSGNPPSLVSALRWRAGGMRRWLGSVLFWWWPWISPRSARGSASTLHSSPGVGLGLPGVFFILSLSHMIHLLAWLFLTWNRWVKSVVLFILSPLSSIFLRVNCDIDFVDYVDIVVFGVDNIYISILRSNMMPICITRLIIHSGYRLHTEPPPLRQWTPHPLRISLGTLNINDGRGSGIAQAIWAVQIDGFDLIILTETNITYHSYCCNGLWYDVVCSTIIMAASGGAQGYVAFIQILLMLLYIFLLNKKKNTYINLVK